MMMCFKIAVEGAGRNSVKLFSRVSVQSENKEEIVESHDHPEEI